jgi:hypothetical protein
MASKNLIIAILFALNLFSLAAQAVDCRDLPKKRISPQDAIGILNLMQNGLKKVFVHQTDPRALSHSGSCGPSCTVNLFQALRVHLRLPVIEDPYQAVAAIFEKLPALQEGKALPSDLIEVIDLLQKTFLSKQGLYRVAYDISDNIPTNSAVLQMTDLPEMIHSNSDAFKMIAFGIGRDHQQVGGHIALYKGLDRSGRIILVDSNFPDDYQYFRFERGTVNGHSTYFLEPEPGSYLFRDHGKNIVVYVNTFFVVKPR